MACDYTTANRYYDVLNESEKSYETKSGWQACQPDLTRTVLILYPCPGCPGQALQCPDHLAKIYEDNALRRGVFIVR